MFPCYVKTGKDQIKLILSSDRDNGRRPSCQLGRRWLRVLYILQQTASFSGEAHLGAADWAPGNWVPCRLDAGHMGAVSSYEEKTMKQAIP